MEYRRPPVDPEPLGGLSDGLDELVLLALNGGRDPDSVLGGIDDAALAASGGVLIQYGTWSHAFLLGAAAALPSLRPNFVADLALDLAELLAAIDQHRAVQIGLSQ